MESKIKILAGNPNDDNRDYLPEAIKGSDMVVNENGNNSQVYPERLKEYKGKMAGAEYTWYEYVPESYDGSTKVPLVISMHGGLMSGWGQAIYTSWTMVADREGFIVVLPNAGIRKFWLIEYEKDKLEEATAPRDDDVYLNIPPEDPDDNQDMNMVIELIGKMKEKYAIDEGRIFMQGMSMGNLMTAQFARYHGKQLAGMAGSGGPTSPPLLYDKEGGIINRGGPVAVWQSRCELDVVPPHFAGDTATVVKKNREYWKAINGCKELPEIKIDGEDNFAFYRGEHADIVFRDIKNRDHGQTLDDAELVWDYLYSGTQRDESGKIIHTQSICERKGDEYAIALAAGKGTAFLSGRKVAMQGEVFTHQKLKYHGLNGGAKVRGEYFMAPVSFVAEAIDAKIESEDNGYVARLTLNDGRTLQFARGSIGCAVDGRVSSMLCEAIYKNGELNVPIEWVCQKILNNHVSSCEGVVYITDHYSALSKNMAYLIRDEILI